MGRNHQVRLLRIVGYEAYRLCCPFGKDFEQEIDLVHEFEPKRYRAMEAVFGQSYEYTRQFLAYREQMKSLQRNADQIRLEGFYE